MKQKLSTSWAILAFLAALPVSAATLTFTNASNQTITNTANWTGGTPTFNTTVGDRWNINGTTTYTAAQGTTTLSLAGRPLVLGATSDSASGNLNVSGGTLNLVSTLTATDGSAASLLGAGAGNSWAGSATLTVSGGNVTVGELGLTSRGTAAASSTLNINSGSLTADLISFSTLADSAGTATINLNGGVLAVRVVFERLNLANPVINFNGGTLRSNDSNNDEDWIRSTNGGATVNILSGGATFDARGQSNQRINVAMGGAGSATFTDSLGGGGVVLTANNNYAGTSTINAGARVVAGNGGTTGSLGSGAVTNNGTLAFARSDNLTQSSISALASGIGGSGVFEQKGPGTLTLNVANSYSGQTLVSGGALRISNASALGTTAGATVVAADARLEMAGGITVSGETLRIGGDGGSSGGYKGALQSVSGDNTWAGPLELSYDLSSIAGNRFGANAGASLTITGSISDVSPSGLARFVVRGDNTGVVNLAGHGHAWGGDTCVYNGILRLVADGSNGGTNVLPTNRNVVLGYGATLYGTLDLNGVNQKVLAITTGSGAVAASQTITNNGSANSVLTIEGGTNQSFGGVIQDGPTNKVSLVKSGSGTQTLDGTNTYTGSTTVAAGLLAVNGSLGNTAVTVESGGTLAGSGVLNGPVTVQGTHSPGNSPGLQTFSNGLAYTSSSTLIWELNANDTATRGTNFDGVNVTGGTLTVASGSEIDLVFSGGVDFTNAFWTTGHSWLVLDLNGGTSGGTTTFTVGSVGLDPNNVSSSTYGTFGTTYNTSTGDHYLLWSAIPEPSVGGLSLLALAFGWRRRR